MTTFNYYEAPSDHVFNDIKTNAEKIWKTYDDTHGYASDKVKRIQIGNIKDNAWYIVAMFDVFNQAKLLAIVEPETATEIRKAMMYGSN